jgi:dipeptidyl aminopeptidase/acylaminoacyl peptidase
MISSQGISTVTDLALPPRVDAELSHDGEFVAYDSCFRPDRGIYVTELGTSQTRRVIPVDHGPACYQVRWSLDDHMLSYVNPANHALNVVAVDGSNHVSFPATAIAGWQSWSPSGEEIVYENGRGGSRSLQIIDLRGKVRELAHFGNHFGDLNSCETWAPDWSPDGTRISFVSCDRLFTVSPQGTDMQQLASDAYSPRWSVDGQWILFLSGSTLMRVRRDGQLLSRVAMLPPPYSGLSPFSLGRVR